MGIRSLAAELAAVRAAAAAARRVRRRPPPSAAGRVVRRADRQARLPRRKADIKQVREAYKFADEAHLGQFRASGEPYITHPIAVAGLCADWKLDVQAIMAALMHDTIEDCGVTKAELIERFGAPTAELVDGLTKLDKLQLHHARGDAGRVVPQDAAGDGARRARDPGQAGRPAAQHAHDARDGARQAPAHRPRDARHLRADRAPPGPEPDLPRAAGAVVRAPVPVAPRRRWPRRCSARAATAATSSSACSSDVEKAFAAAKIKVQVVGPREDGVLDLPQDAREAR